MSRCGISCRCSPGGVAPPRSLPSYRTRPLACDRPGGRIPCDRPCQKSQCQHDVIKSRAELDGMPTTYDPKRRTHAPGSPRAEARSWQRALRCCAGRPLARRRETAAQETTPYLPVENAFCLGAASQTFPSSEARPAAANASAFESRSGEYATPTFGSQL